MNKKIIALLLVLSTLVSGCGYIHPTPSKLSQNFTVTAIAATIYAQYPSKTPAGTQETQESPTANPITPSATQEATGITPIVLNTATPYPTATYAYYPTQAYCDDSEYISDITIPDYADIYPGQLIHKTWKIYNSGTCTWNKDYDLSFLKGKRMDGDDTYMPHYVEPGEYIKITVDMIAPLDEGKYIGYWQMENDYGDFFGDVMTIRIHVTKSASTLTFTPSKTATKTATPTFTSSPTTSVTPTTTSTFTVTPSVTASSTPTLTPTNTATDTATSTPTFTPTFTDTVAPSETPTFTNTPG
jgi:hypothetical protein